MNRSKDLRDLFRKSLARKRTEVRTPPMYNTRPNFMNHLKDGKIKVYFYEWSDIYRVPRTFTDMEELERFLKASSIYMELYQKEIVNNLDTVYMTCYKGTKNLNVRATYAALMDSMNTKEPKPSTDRKRDSTPLTLPFENPKPYEPLGGGSMIQRPPMVEPEGRWAENGEYGSFWY